jgi:cell division protein FtsZ
MVSIIEQAMQNAQAEQENPKLLTKDHKKVSQENNNQDIDAELEQILARQRATIKVVGCGGGGNNTINRMSEVGIVGVETIAVNTDAQDLLYTTANKKILIGRELTKGLGAGSEPRLGEEAASEL